MILQALVDFRTWLQRSRLGGVSPVQAGAAESGAVAPELASTSPVWLFRSDASVDQSQIDQAYSYSACAYTSVDVSSSVAHMGMLPWLGIDALDSGLSAGMIGELTEGDDSDPHIWELCNYEDAEVHELRAGRVPLGMVLHGCRVCLYCRSRLVVGKTERWPFVYRGGLASWGYTVASCPVCGWWVVSFLQSAGGLQGDEITGWHAYGVLQAFKLDALDTPLSLAREYLHRNPHKLARFDPYRFEDLIADCLRDCWGDSEIVKLGGRKDGGIDIKVVRMEGRSILIQVKRHTDFSKPEGVEVVRNLHGVMLREGTPHGMVITTAHDFTQGARDEVRQTGQRLREYSMELLSLDNVIELLALPQRPRPDPWTEFGIRLDRRIEHHNQTQDWIERSVIR